MSRADAQKLCATAVREAERRTEEFFRNVVPFQGVVRNKFVEFINDRVSAWSIAGGGRATLLNNYGVDLNGARYLAPGQGTCQ